MLSTISELQATEFIPRDIFVLYYLIVAGFTKGHQIH